MVSHGPYSEYVERKIKAEDIIKLMQGKSNRKAFYKEVMAYCEYKKEPITFTTYTRGIISECVSGTKGWNFDRIFILDEIQKLWQITQMKKEQKSIVMKIG